MIRGNDTGWLVDLRLETVLWLRICLASPEHRAVSDGDPTCNFEGKVQIGGYTVQRPISFETAETIRKISTPRIGVDPIPGKRKFRALLIGIVENEVQSDNRKGG